MGNLPFSIYFDFETTTGDAVFFDTKMYVVSYCMIVPFNPSLNFDKMVIYRSYQQTAFELYDISHFKQQHVPFFDQVTLRQLKDAAFAVAFKEKCTSLAEMFCIELKFTIDTLNLWFNKTIKTRFYELEYLQKDPFKGKNPLSKETLCSICNFPMNPYQDNGWLDHIVKAEHLFIKNIYDRNQMKKMEIDNLEDYQTIIYNMLNLSEEFEGALENDKVTDNIVDFLRLETLGDSYGSLAILKEDIQNTTVPKRPFAKKHEIFKMIAFLYSNLISFEPTEKAKGPIISGKFISNISAIISNKGCLHYSHITGKVIRYVYQFCNEKVRENYYKIPVIAHNLFRFDFFFLIKGLRATEPRNKRHMYRRNESNRYQFCIGRQSSSIYRYYQIFSEEFGGASRQFG